MVALLHRPSNVGDRQRLWAEALQRRHGVAVVRDGTLRAVITTMRFFFFFFFFFYSFEHILTQVRSLVLSSATGDGRATTSAIPRPRVFRARRGRLGIGTEKRSSIANTMFSIVPSMPANGASRGFPVGGPEKGGADVSTLATRAPVAQGIERAPPEREVEGSNPSGRMMAVSARPRQKRQKVPRTVA